MINKNKKMGFCLVILIIILIIFLGLSLITNHKLKKESTIQSETNTSLENSIKKLEEELDQAKKLLDELSWDVSYHIENTTSYDPETKTYFYTVDYDGCGTEMVSYDKDVVSFKYLYDNSGFFENDGYKNANRVSYDSQVYTLNKALKELEIDYRKSPIYVFYSDIKIADEVNMIYKWGSIELGDYTFTPSLSEGGVLNFTINDKDGNFYEKTIQPRIDYNVYFQDMYGFDWAFDNWDAYDTDYNALSSEYIQIDILEEIKNLTDMELNEYDTKAVSLFFEFIQDKNCVLPGVLSADSYYDDLRFDMIDLDKNGTAEMLINKGVAAIYIPNGTWAESYVVSDIIRINVNDGIIDVTKGDICGEKDYYRFNGFDSELLTFLTWDTTILEGESNTTVYTLNDPKTGEMEISGEEFDVARYDVVAISENTDIDWKKLNPSILLQFFYK